MKELTQACVLLCISGPLISFSSTAAIAQAIFSIENTSSHLVVDVIGASTIDRQGVILFTPNNNKNQLFQMVIPDPNHWDQFELVAEHSHKCLDVYGAEMNNGARIIQFECHDRPNQLWTINRVGNVKTLKAVHSGKCLDAGNPQFPAPPKRDAVLQQWTCISRQDAPNSVNQVFTLGGN